MKSSIMNEVMNSGHNTMSNAATAAESWVAFV